MLNLAPLQESEMVRETSQWEREEMEKVVSETENPLLFWGNLEVELYLSDQQIDSHTTRKENYIFAPIIAQKNASYCRVEL